MSVKFMADEIDHRVFYPAVSEAMIPGATDPSEVGFRTNVSRGWLHVDQVPTLLHP
jgi:hypothetical protein